MSQHQHQPAEGPPTRATEEPSAGEPQPDLPPHATDADAADDEPDAQFEPMSSAELKPRLAEHQQASRARASAESAAENEAAESEQQQVRRYRPQKYCAVCGDKAIACNFNAVTCESCKAFFRRNAFKEQRLKCLFDNRCVIDRVTRRFCSKCRLLRCFHIGMKREWILTDEQKQIKRVKILQNQQSRQQVAPVRDESQRAVGSEPRVARRRATESSGNSASEPVERPSAVRRCPSSARPKETRDAATNCPDDDDPPHLRHFCTLALQCQYCSLFVNATGGAPSSSLSENYAPAHHHHAHPQVVSQQQLAAEYQQQQHHHQLVAMQAAGRLSYASNVPATQMLGYGEPHHQQVAGHHQSTPSCCCVEHGNCSNVQAAAIQYATHAGKQPQGQPPIPRRYQSQAAPMQPAQLHMLRPATAFMPPSAQGDPIPSGPGAATGAPVSLEPATGGNQHAASSSEQQPSIITLTNSSTVASCQPGEALSSASTTPNASATSGEHLISEQKAVDAANEQQVGSTQSQEKVAELLVYNGEVFAEPTSTEAEMRSRIERLAFIDHERQLMYEMIDATKFMFEHTEKFYHQQTEPSLNRFVQLCDAALRRLIKTVKRIKAFRMLSMDDQIVLLKTACFKILLLRSIYHYHDDCQGWRDSRTGRIMRIDLLRCSQSKVHERHLELVHRIPKPMRKDRLVLAIMAMTLLFDPSISLKHSNSVALDNLVYLGMLRKYLISTQPDPLTKYQILVDALKVVNECNEEYNIFFSKDCQPEQITPLLIEIFDISINNTM